MSLNGKVALVTGSTSGIGQGIAEALAAEGASIMLNGFGDAAKIEALRASFEQRFGVKALYNGADISKGDANRGDGRGNPEGFGFAGYSGEQRRHPVHRAGRGVSRRQMGSDHRDQHVGRVSRDEGGDPRHEGQGLGRIINIASAHGLVASPFKVAYVAAKHGVLGMTKVAAIELANSGVTVNAICPGWVLTPLVQKQLEDRAKATGTTVEKETHAFVTEKQPMAQFSTPEEIGGLAVFLCSDAAKTITGVPLSIDGGWTAQ